MLVLVIDDSKAIRLILAQKRVSVDGNVATDIAQIVDQFSSIVMDDNVLQQNKAHYIMLNKPIGVVCATKDEKHKTVIDFTKDLLDHNATPNQITEVSCDMSPAFIKGVKEA